jgi:hypothetical protein
MWLRSVLPEEHLCGDSRDVIKMGLGMVVTMAALVLGLLVASAKSNYDAQSAELIQVSANAVLLDRGLAHYGPEAKEAREELSNIVARVLKLMWAEDPTMLDPARGGAEILYGTIEDLSPKDDERRILKSQMLSMAMNLGQTRWLMYEQSVTAVSMPLIVIVVFWLTVIFLGWGLLAHRNITLIVTMLVSALSVSGAIFLILGMYSPYRGLIRISDAPLRAALAALGQ